MNNNKQTTMVSDKPKQHFFRASASDFKKIPGSPIAYWVSDNVSKAFEAGKELGSISSPRKGNSTSDNDRFLRFWPELCFDHVGLNLVSYSSEFRWIPYNKGGGFLKWYGHNSYLIDWKDQGAEIRRIPTAVIANESLFFKPGLTWGTVTSSHFSIRWFDEGYIFDNGGCCVFNSGELRLYIMALLNSAILPLVIGSINPTLNFQSGDVAKFPVLVNKNIRDQVDSNASHLLKVSKADWDSYETSWDFTSLPLLQSNFHQPTIKAAYTQLRDHWLEMTLEMQCLEQENNNIFIDVYGLQGELFPEVPLTQITLTCNPHYRYGNNKNAEELETLLLADTLKEFISYAVGCMFCRYALDKPGLILANQGETIADYLKQIPEPVFSADDDNVIPMLDGDWFTDDVTERFGQFLKVTFGDAHYEENLKFIEQALGKDIRKYFLKDFYTDHLKRYKKRPIYWLFSSPKGTFNALIYMHRYRPDTVSVVLNDYLREFRTKLSAHKNHLEAVSISSNASAGEKTKALKDIENHRKMIDELDVYEREVLYPLATEQVEIDLDDGVKVNYQKFGEALKKIPGLAAKED